MARQTQRTIIMMLLGAVIVVIFGWWWTDRSEVSRVCFLNVGHGQAIVVYHAGIAVLIDAGSNEEIVNELEKALPINYRTIHLAIMTHPHADHIAGFEAVGERYDIEHALFTNVPYASRTYERVRALLTRVPHTIIMQPMFFEWKGMRIETLYPRRSFDDVTVKEVNNTSIVTLISFGELDFLFTADIEQPVEDELISVVKDRLIEVMTVPHHGSLSSSSDAFIDAVSPQLAIIPVSPNTYGHPAHAVMERYRIRGIQIVRTDEQGTLCYGIDQSLGGLKRIK